jgi:hypothetical protein
MTIAISGTNGITLDGQFNSASSMGFKNRIINGAMVIDQRNAGASVSVSSYGYVLDRFGFSITGGGVFTAQRSTTAPSGFINSQALTVTTADSSIAAGDTYQAFHKIEGFNFSDMGFGTANAQTFTLSFWVRSSVTGTYAVGFNNNAFNRSYVATYTINSANTFEYKTITVTGDTSGTWLTDNSIGINISFDLGSGSNFNATAGSWGAGSLSRTSGSVNWIATSGATFYITGVQLEKGSTATSFDYRPYGTELALCQRYFYSIPASTVGLGGWGSYNGATSGVLFYYNPVTMRTAPSVSNITGTLAVFGVNNTASCTLSASRQSVNMLQFDFSSASNSLSAGYPVSYNGSTAMQVSAEL